MCADVPVLVGCRFVYADGAAHVVACVCGVGVAAPCVADAGHSVFVPQRAHPRHLGGRRGGRQEAGEEELQALQQPVGAICLRCDLRLLSLLPCRVPLPADAAARPASFRLSSAGLPSAFARTGPPSPFPPRLSSAALPPARGCCCPPSSLPLSCQLPLRPFRLPSHARGRPPLSPRAFRLQPCRRPAVAAALPPRCLSLVSCHCGPAVCLRCRCPQRHVPRPCARRPGVALAACSPASEAEIVTAFAAGLVAELGSPEKALTAAAVSLLTGDKSLVSAPLHRALCARLCEGAVIFSVPVGARLFVPMSAGCCLCVPSFACCVQVYERHPMSCLLPPPSPNCSHTLPIVPRPPFPISPRAHTHPHTHTRPHAPSGRVLQPDGRTTVPDRPGAFQRDVSSICACGTVQCLHDWSCAQCTPIVPPPPRPSSCLCICALLRAL
jgi:hypothetical protein